MIPYGRQDINEDDIKNVVQALTSDFLTQGPLVPRFELQLCEELRCAEVVVVNSATSALHLSCLALDIGPSDIVWTSPISFVASANCALYCGAEVNFVDINPNTFNMCEDKLEEKLLNAKKLNRLPKVIIAVHMAGQSPNMERISHLARKYDIKIIEDASHAIGAYYKGNPVGHLQYSDIAVFSFHPVKIITTCEGGAAVTNNKKIAEKIKLLRSHGITRDKRFLMDTNQGDWYYEQTQLGWNYRLTEIQAALGLSQLKRLKEFIETRKVLANRYDKLLKYYDIKLPGKQEFSNSSNHLYIIRLLKEKKLDRKKIFLDLRELGIGVNVHYIPIHLQPLYKHKFNFKVGDFPLSEEFYNSAISIPLYQGMSFSSQEYVCECLEKVGLK
jgi:UDP-4-amino-4,6-dideoxy-N-acetyl-beta-L-altrosamine transaminase